MEYLQDGRVAIKASNDRYLTAKLNGSLYATMDIVDDKGKFTITIVNRPILVLRCDFGFLGFKTPSNPRVECNKSTSGDVIHLEHNGGADPSYLLKGKLEKLFN